MAATQIASAAILSHVDGIDHINGIDGIGGMLEPRTMRRGERSSLANRHGAAPRLRRVLIVEAAVLLALTSGLCLQPPVSAASDHQSSRDVVVTLVEPNVAVPMRDGIVLRADLYRPGPAGRYPVLVYRTPYGKNAAAQDYRIHTAAVQRGYAVVLQDVRGRYESDGVFDPYAQEGRDGFDTIEWAARQPWSNGKVGTFGLSYPGAVQWLAAMERPPHLVAMVPAMTFSSPRHFFYASGVFDLSWLPWIYVNVAPDRRRRLDLPGTRDASVAAREWREVATGYLSWLPLGALPYLRREAPFYFEWLAHPPEDPWWNWAELRGRYADVTAAVLNLSGWYDEAYGPEGAVTNFQGLTAARATERDSRANLLIGPWMHGVASTAAQRTGELDFGPGAAIDYDDVVLDFLDRHLKGVANDFSTAPRVRYFVMGANEWRVANDWPPQPATRRTLYLARDADERRGRLQADAPVAGVAHAASSEFVADPRNPVLDPYVDFGPHDYRALADHSDVLTFETEPLAQDWLVAGAVDATIRVSCDCRDFDLWVRLQDVHPDGRAINLMSPGNDVLRASYRLGDARRELLQPGQVYELRLPMLLTGNLFARGHRIRAQISASFGPHLSRNLQTGESEVSSSESRPARITIHHGSGEACSRLSLPVLDPTTR
jgi:putative CocE/NonD family hydrolase